MLEYAGLPILMANAVPALLERGWQTTGTQDECGVASAIRRFALAR
jgi:hydroxymethylpyrimidine pyrophosphatase-like HAD family hydrolase